MDSLSGHLDDASLRRISGALGTDQGATSKALAAAVLCCSPAWRGMPLNPAEPACSIAITTAR